MAMQPTKSDKIYESDNKISNLTTDHKSDKYPLQKQK